MALTHEERVEMGRRGGVASGVAKRKKKAMKESLSILMNKSMRGHQIRDAKSIEELAKRNGLNITAQDAIMVAMILKAQSGDVSAATFIRDTLGEKEPDRLEVGMSYEEYVKTHKAKF